MHICYIDESGTPEVSGNTSHFILAGVSIPIWHWKAADLEISRIKTKYGIENSEIHTAWILRPYREQSAIKNFDSLNRSRRRAEVNSLRTKELLRCQRLKNNKKLNQTKKTHRNTKEYIHLTSDERKRLIKDLAKCISKWGFARLFAECIDKTYSGAQTQPIAEQAFEQLISRFEQYLENISKNPQQQNQSYGLIVHDNNQTVCKKHTELMKGFHQKGTFWTQVSHIIETPLFVDSQLTSMVQIADLCAYALRRYLENKEQELFDLIFARADRKPRPDGKPGPAVGVRHFTSKSCKCVICAQH